MYMATNELIDNAVKRGIISYNTAFAINVIQMDRKEAVKFT